MEFNSFARKPFVVEAVEVTVENIAEIAETVGTLATKEDGTPYIRVNQKVVPNIYRVFPGFWMTKMGDNIRCYSGRVFAEQFAPVDDNIAAWVAHLNQTTVTANEAATLVNG